MTKASLMVEKYKKRIDRLEKTKHRYNETIDRKISVLNHEKFIWGMRVSAEVSRKQKRCKHDGEKRYTRNCRDDASFESYIYCKKCDGQIGTVRFDGKEHYDRVQ